MAFSLETTYEYFAPITAAREPLFTEDDLDSKSRYTYLQDDPATPTSMEGPTDFEKPLPAPPSPSKWSGWRLTIASAMSFVGIVLAANIILLAWAMTKYDSRDGLAKLYDGDCDRASSHYFWTHLSINVCGAILLAASNCAMQVVSAPTRQEIDEAHPQHALEIGVLGYRNWRFIAARRRLLWVLLALSSLPISLLWVPLRLQFSTARPTELLAATIPLSSRRHSPSRSISGR